jgi:molybdenum cofactor cytidylyltransferase
MPAVASQYGDRAGTPALFHRSLFPRLMELKGDTGARKLIAELGNQVSLMPFEKGIVDIDTKEDYRKLINK